MKKLLSLITAAALSFAVISCANMVESSPETVQDYIDAAETSVDISGSEIADGASLEIKKAITVTGGDSQYDLKGAKVTVKAPGVVLKNVKNISELIVDESVGDGDFTMSNCEVAKLTVNGGGSNSIHADSVKIAAVTIAKAGVRFVMEGTTAVASVDIQAACTLDSTSPTAVIATVNIAAAVPAITVKGKTNLTNLVASSADFKITVASNDVVVAAAVVKTADGKITAVNVEAADGVTVKEIPLPKDDQKKLEEQNKELEKKDEEKKDDKKDDKQPETTPPQPATPNVSLPASVGVNELKGLKIESLSNSSSKDEYIFSDTTVEVTRYRNGAVFGKIIFDYSYNSIEKTFCMKLKCYVYDETTYIYTFDDALEYYGSDLFASLTEEELQIQKLMFEELFNEVDYKKYEILGNLFTMYEYFNPEDTNVTSSHNGRISYSDEEVVFSNHDCQSFWVNKGKGDEGLKFFNVRYNPSSKTFTGPVRSKNEGDIGVASGTYKTEGRGISGCSITLVFEDLPDTIDFLTKGKEYVLPVESSPEQFIIDGVQPLPEPPADLPTSVGVNELKEKEATQSTDHATVTYSFSETTFTMTGGMENGITVAEYTYDSNQKIIYYCTRKIIYNNNEYATPASFVDAFCSYNPTVAEEFKQEMLTVYEQQFYTVSSVNYQINDHDDSIIEFVIPTTD